ncbi:putative ubiquitin-conjugating enzyme E2 38 [Humulus lupulus]|uniref:putative ubiquitin-conjugating enzyme E2 38 n=1 Tax=Humulus lupulus TaxID=3486 RepID=UPI002B407D4E|nr:putative ubiquitin-conjugating enzyme E2 38 [Humulus lupulus]
MKLFGYDDAMQSLEAREAQEFYEIVKLRMEQISKASQLNQTQKMNRLNLAGVTKPHHNTHYGEIEEIEVEAETNFQRLKHFDIFETPPSDHHFIYPTRFAKLFSFAPTPKKSLKKKMSREWEILASQLPNSMFYIRVYKSRRDLLRVVVINEKAATNSYHHGLFFFDLFFPGDYPSKPPMVFYHSYGESHPKLHQRGGEVCSNLFKNWRELIQSNEESPILNVLVSIQNFVSSSISEFKLERSMVMRCKKDVVVRTSEAILHMLESPLKGYEVFVVGYFLLRAHYILLNYKKFTDPDDEDLNKLFLKLIKAFEKNGTYCKHHY